MQRGGRVVKIAYADPPYIGCAGMYADHPDYDGEVDHAVLVERLLTYDGFILHSHVPGLKTLLAMMPEDARVMAWVKPFAAFKANVSVAYAWEPVLIRAARKPVVTERIIMRDWISEPITLKRGLVGAKPAAVCKWAFALVGAQPGDELYDMFPGTGAVTRAWEEWLTDQGEDFQLVMDGKP
jgi:hypothetical protein